MQMIEDLLIGFPSEKSLVGMHAVPSKEGYTFLGDMLLDVSQEALGRLLWCHCRVDDGSGEAALAICTRPSPSALLSCIFRNAWMKTYERVCTIRPS